MRPASLCTAPEREQRAPEGQVDSAPGQESLRAQHVAVQLVERRRDSELGDWIETVRTMARRPAAEIHDGQQSAHERGHAFHYQAGPLHFFAQLGTGIAANMTRVLTHYAPQ